MPPKLDRSRIVALVMAGGGGTRFWPRSRRSLPKQFLSFDGERSLFALAVERLKGLIPDEQILVITSKEHEEVARRHVDLPERSIVGEPALRDTAACIGYGARLAQSIREDAVLLVVCADHLVSPVDRFREAILRAAELGAADDVLVTIGIRPDRPATGYGYIETGEMIGDERPVARKVVCFREKPDLETARRFILAGRFLWNSGMFAFTGQTVLAAMRSWLPDLHGRLMGMRDPWDMDEVARVYEDLPCISIDFGILEKAPNKVVVEAEFDWDDVGTFEAVARHAQKRNDENLSRGDAAFFDASGNLVDNACDGLVVLSGVNDVLVVRTEDAVLIIPRKDAERVKGVVHRLEQEGWSSYL